jgi:hypothetical protein
MDIPSSKVDKTIWHFNKQQQQQQQLPNNNNRPTTAQNHNPSRDRQVGGRMEFFGGSDCAITRLSKSIIAIQDKIVSFHHSQQQLSTSWQFNNCQQQPKITIDSGLYSNFVTDWFVGSTLFFCVTTDEANYIMDLSNEFV